MLVEFEAAVYALACHLAIGGPPEEREKQRARCILLDCVPPDHRANILNRKA